MSTAAEIQANLVDLQVKNLDLTLLLAEQEPALAELALVWNDPAQRAQLVSTLPPELVDTLIGGALKSATYAVWSVLHVQALQVQEGQALAAESGEVQPG